MQRRTFINLCASAAGAALATLSLGACDRAPRSDASTRTETSDTSAAATAPLPTPQAPRFFTAAEVPVITAILARLFPAEAHAGAPGHEATHLLVHVDTQLATPDYRTSFERMVRAGVGFVDRVAQRRHGRPFADLDAATQDAILADFQTGSIRGLEFPQGRFFKVIHTLGLEGYWGAPSYTGSQTQLAWRWVDIHPECPHLHGGTCQP